MEDFTDHDGMIAAVEALGDPAFDIAQDIVENGRSVVALVPFKPGKFVDSLGGETAGKLFLMFAEEVDRERIPAFKAGVALRRFVDADQDQRGIEGQ